MNEKHAESSRAGWLGFFFGDSHRRRLTIAIAAAIALHEIAAGLIPPLFPQQKREETIAQVAVLTVERRPKPTPSPKPTPQPTPRVRVIAQRTIIVPKVVEHRASAAKQLIHRNGASRPTIKTVNHSKPIWDIPTGAQGAGAGKGAGAGSLGSGGNGTGAGGGTQPCGFVSFSDPHGSDYDRRTGGFFVDITMTVSFPDKHTEDVELDYPFYYPSETANPFSDENVRDHPDMEIKFQFPPVSKRGAEPSLVQYVIDHTTSDGYTKMKDCPADAPAP